MTTFPEIINLWPSRTAFASDIGVSLQAATNMVARNSLASSHWSKAIAGARARRIKGVTLKSLMAAASRPKVVTEKSNQEGLSA